jgi:hypothetical protein
MAGLRQLTALRDELRGVRELAASGPAMLRAERLLLEACLRAVSGEVLALLQRYNVAFPSGSEAYEPGLLRELLACLLLAEQDRARARSLLLQALEQAFAFQARVSSFSSSCTVLRTRSGGCLTKSRAHS